MFYYRNATEITSIAPISTNENITVYPNPVVDELSIEWPGVEIENVSIRIVDCIGREQNINTSRQNPGGIKIDVDHLNPGSYFIKVFSSAGALKVLKFVKV